jgi:hypothetical protein
MKSSHPPAVATWMLEHLRSGKPNEYLVGDLIEEYERGRSKGWYRKQVLSAIVMSFWKEIYSHAWLAAKATATGWIIQFLFQFIAWGLVSRFHIRTPLLHKLPTFFGYGVAASLTWLILWSPIWIGSGWYVGRLYRPHLTCMVLMFSVSVLGWKLLTFPWTIHLLFDAAGNSRYLPQLVIEIMNFVLPSVYIVLGGLLAGFCIRESSIQDSQRST